MNRDHTHYHKKWKNAQCYTMLLETRTLLKQFLYARIAYALCTEMAHKRANCDWLKQKPKIGYAQRACAQCAYNICSMSIPSCCSKKMFWPTCSNNKTRGHATTHATYVARYGVQLGGGAVVVVERGKHE